jgi:hypothetical protein
VKRFVGNDHYWIEGRLFMRSVMVVLLSLVLFVGGSAFGAENEPKVKIKVVISWPPLKIGLEVEKASANAYHGTAFVEGNNLVVQFDHGTVLPPGGFVVDASSKIAPDTATRLGLPATQQFVSGTYDAAATTYFTITGADGPTIRLPLKTSASRSFTCVATVATDGGKALLGKGTVSGATITAAASACHDFTRKKFAANLAWSDPARVCARAPSSTPRRVEALDHFEELGNAGGYNRVGGYSVVCTATPQVTQFPTAPEVVKR